MEIMFSIAVLVEIILMGFCALKSGTKEGKLAYIVCLFESCAFICGILFAASLYIPNATVVTFCKGMTYVGFDWLLVLLLYYTEYYTGLFKGVTKFKILIFAYFIADSVLLCANTWTHWIFQYNFTTDSTKMVRTIYNDYLFNTHFLVSYALMTFIVVVYFVMIIKSSKFYRFCYELIFVVLFIGYALDFASIGIRSLYRFSMLAFGCMAILIYYCTLSYVPDALIENTLSLIIQDMNSGIICFDYRGRCVYCNDMIKGLKNVNADVQNMEIQYHQWMEEQKEDFCEMRNMQFPVAQENGQKIYDITYKRLYDDKKNHICDCFVCNDRTEELAVLEREKYRASHDNVTNLLNKEQFYQDVYELIHKNRNTKYCLICSNIKDFKFVNKLFGVEKGDSILIRQAELMREYAKEDGLVARLQSDRFAVCIPKEKFDDEKIYSSIQKLQDEIKTSNFRMHIFVGVYDIDDIDEPISIMCDKANLAGTTIESDYHNYIAFYSDKLFEQSVEERKIIGEFEGALKRDEFVMFLQPQVDEKGELYGAEALVRWQHPDRGLLSPAMFIEVLEKAGWIYKLDCYIWEQAAKKLFEWKEMGQDKYHISVNISTKDFYFIDIYETFTGLVEKYGISPDKLNLEITETALMSDFKKNMEVLKRLQNAGFKIEIDDFGSGYSSLNMLKDISAEILKIDMGFLRASENEVKGMDILESVIMLAGKLGMEVITEGVEMKKQLHMLSQMGCRIFQGYYFSKPVPVKEFEEKYHIGL